jgi:hypothetical protein
LRYQHHPLSSSPKDNAPETGDVAAGIGEVPTGTPTARMARKRIT